jgi:hypothetical protein
LATGSDYHRPRRIRGLEDVCRDGRWMIP